MAIQDRVAILKGKIADQIRGERHNHDKNPSDIILINENIEYEDRENEPITPISEKDPRKKKDKFKLKEIKTTRDIGQNFKSEKYFDSKIPQRNNDHDSGKALQRISQNKQITKNTLKPIQKKIVKKTKITDVFYRRMFSDKFANTWTHCQDLITPFLTGHKTNMTTSKRVAYDDHVVIR